LVLRIPAIPVTPIKTPLNFHVWRSFPISKVGFYPLNSPLFCSSP
jgi:hypothetical protein